MSTAAALLVAAGLAALAAALGARVAHVRGQRVATITHLSDDTRMGADGIVRSVQAGDVTFPADQLERIWSPMYLERLARTYWRFLSRCTLGLIRVAYAEEERFVVLIARPLVLLRFRSPSYEMDERRGVVQWCIERGVLVSRAGRGGRGYLQIDVQRVEPEGESDAADDVTLHIEVEVANFYPAISGISEWIYTNTQSRIHVLVTYGFLRSLACLDLAPSRVGRFEGIDDVDDPPPAGEPARRPASSARAEPPGARV